MTRAEVKELLPILQAFVEGKQIQWKNYYHEWRDTNEIMSLNGDFIEHFRIKPEPKYRPFKTREECWQEMLKHEPFGCLKDCSEYHLVSSVGDVYIWFSDRVYYTFEEALDTFKFADGTPFGIKED